MRSSLARALLVTGENAVEEAVDRGVTNEVVGTQSCSLPAQDGRHAWSHDGDPVLLAEARSTRLVARVAALRPGIAAGRRLGDERVAEAPVSLVRVDGGVPLPSAPVHGVEGVDVDVARVGI